MKKSWYVEHFKLGSVRAQVPILQSAPGKGQRLKPRESFLKEALQNLALECTLHATRYLHGDTMSGTSSLNVHQSVRVNLSRFCQTS